MVREVGLEPFRKRLRCADLRCVPDTLTAWLTSTDSVFVLCGHWVKLIPCVVRRCTYSSKIHKGTSRVQYLYSRVFEFLGLLYWDNSSHFAYISKSHRRAGCINMSNVRMGGYHSGGAVLLSGGVFGIPGRWLRVPDEDVESRHDDDDSVIFAPTSTPH